MIDKLAISDMVVGFIEGLFLEQCLNSICFCDEILYADLGSTWVIDNLVKNNPTYVFHKRYDSFNLFKKTV